VKKATPIDVILINNPQFLQVNTRCLKGSII